ncbi:unnamed protein product [Closterium sp. Naga37s-1]|nr:unnamed protein product [Closterium sp. Naga37s-1]
MGSKIRRAGVVRCPVGIVALMCVAAFFMGSFYGSGIFGRVPDLRAPARAVPASFTNPAHRGIRLERGGDHRGSLDSGAEGEGEAGGKGKGGAEGEGVGADGEGSHGWPAFDHGTSGESSVSTVPFQMISWHPRAYVFPRFAPRHVCENVLAAASKRMAPSGLALRPGENEEGTRDIRTSSGTFLAANMDPSGSLAWVERKMAAVTGLPVNHGESFNVLRYELGQHYDSHMDVFDPKEYGPQSSNRMASFLLYLTDVEEGGETMFPYEGGRNMHIGYNYKDCIGLKVKPRMGDALLFWSIYPNGTIDPTSLHGSCPVVKGSKWVATKWIRDKPFSS